MPATINKELNYGTAVYYKIYNFLGLPQFFGNISSYHELPFSFNAVVFAICYFNIECKLSDGLDLRNLHKRRCIFDFSEATPENIETTIEVFKAYEPQFIPFIEDRTKGIISTKAQMIKHSPNPKVVLKSLAYLMRSLFFKLVHEAGFTITKDPLFTLLNKGTILKRTYDQGYTHVNKAYGIYGDESHPINVQKLMHIFGIDASLPMRNFAELQYALGTDFPLNPLIKAETPDELPPIAGTKNDIGDKPGCEDKVGRIYGLNFLFPETAEQTTIPEMVHRGPGTKNTKAPLINPLPALQRAKAKAAASGKGQLQKEQSRNAQVRAAAAAELEAEQHAAAAAQLSAAAAMQDSPPLSPLAASLLSSAASVEPAKPVLSTKTQGKAVKGRRSGKAAAPADAAELEGSTEDLEASPRRAQKKRSARSTTADKD